MGLVYDSNKSRGLVHNYPAELKRITDAMIDPGKEWSDQQLDPVSDIEVDRILLKLDNLASDKISETVARLVAMSAMEVIDTVRLVKAQNHQTFMGFLGSGNMLDIKWIRPKDIGNPQLRGVAAAGALGIYAQAPLAAGTFTWLRTFVENTAQNLLPNQTMSQFAAVIHLGFMETIDGISKISDYTYTSGGVAAPPQSIHASKKHLIGTSQDPAVLPMEKPIIVPPFRGQQITLQPTFAGDSRIELLSFIVGQCADFTTNV